MNENLLEIAKSGYIRGIIDVLQYILKNELSIEEIEKLHVKFNNIHIDNFEK